MVEGSLNEFAPGNGGGDGSNRNIDPLREKIFNMLMKKLSNVEADPSGLSDAAMEVADDVASESEFVDFKQLPMWVEMVLDKVQGMAEGLGKDIKRLATGKDIKSRAGQEIAKSQDANMKGDHKTSKKHFDRFDKLDKLANKEQGVAEGDK
jgi:hypothetical protein